MSYKSLFFIAAILGCLMVIVAGCQSSEVENNPSGTSSQEVPLVPYSKGPTSPPYVRGPSGPPPESGSKPSAVEYGGSQAVTETENVRYALPENPDVKVKQ